MTLDMRNRFKRTQRGIPPVHPETQRVSITTYFQAFFDLSVYDLQYIRLAQTQRVALATMDVAMRSAAQQMNIAVLPE